MNRLPMFSLYLDEGHYNDFLSLEDAVQCGRGLLETCEYPATYTIEDAAGLVVASLTNRRIEGVFVKQRWADEKRDRLAEVERVHFDATGAVLEMRYENLVYIIDPDDECETIGRSRVAWDGPCEVYLRESVCEFFGVDDPEDITREQFAFAQRELRNQAGC